MIRRAPGEVVCCGALSAAASLCAFGAAILGAPWWITAAGSLIGAGAAIGAAVSAVPRRPTAPPPVPVAAERAAGDDFDWRRLLDGIGEGVWEWSPASGHMRFSDGWKAILGSPDIEIGESIESWAEIIHPEDRTRTLGDMEAYLAGDTELYRNEHRVIRPDGEARWVSDRGAAAARDESGSPTLLVGVRTDITDRKEMEDRLWSQAVEISNVNERLAEMAITDALTGLRNRRGFMTRAEEMLTRPEPAGAVVSLDVDFFKRVNDTWGHETGDDVLRAVAQRLLSGAPDPDLVGRMGGEEFAVLCPGATCEEARGVASRLRTTIRETPIPVAGERSLSVTVSLGVTCALPDDTVSTMLNRADQALYEAKGAGRDRERVICPKHARSNGMEAAE